MLRFNNKIQLRMIRFNNNVFMSKELRKEIWKDQN